MIFVVHLSRLTFKLRPRYKTDFQHFNLLTSFLFNMPPRRGHNNEPPSVKLLKKYLDHVNTRLPITSTLLHQINPFESQAWSLALAKRGADDSAFRISSKQGIENSFEEVGIKMLSCQLDKFHEYREKYYARVVPPK